ncbi:MAG: peptidoglycan-associated lipoprotein Pal [Pseudomonadota bacterium]
MTTLRLRSAAILLCAGLALVGCAKNPAVNAALPGAGVAAPGTPAEFTQVVGDRVLFETDSSQLTAAGRATLDAQARWLQQYGRYSVRIEGHADERGTREYNIALGARRAEAVRNYLAARGVNMANASTISFGKERPVAVCNDISCWSQNRRAVTALQ